MQTDSNSKVYFSGLNGLRFIAAAAVIITHVELIKRSFGLKSYWSNPLVFNLGSLGVFFFFVLSGFLITYLLLKEKEATQNIKIKEFYIRRVLRIWPLYYLILILGFFVLPHFSQIHISYLQANFMENYKYDLVMYMFILPNLAFSFFTAVPHIGQSWSIGVEEQFYLFWPWLVKKSKNIIVSASIFIIVLLLIKVMIVLLPATLRQETWYEPLKRFFAMTKLESMAIGSLGAYFLFHKKEKILRFIFNRFVFLFSLLLVPILVYFTPAIVQDGIHVVYSVLFLVIIMNVASGKKMYIGLENKMFSYLGKISYGIYMYHLMIIPIVLYFYKEMNLKANLLVENLTVYIAVFVSTILVSAVSYNIIEERFIKLKTKFTVIKSGQ